MGYVGRLMAHYKWTFDYVAFELPMIQGWVWYAFAMETDGWLNFSGVRRDGDGFVRQQIKQQANDS